MASFVFIDFVQAGCTEARAFFCKLCYSVCSCCLSCSTYCSDIGVSIFNKSKQLYTCNVSKITAHTTRYVHENSDTVVIAIVHWPKHPLWWWSHVALFPGSSFWSLVVCINWGSRRGGSYHVICGMTNAMDVKRCWKMDVERWLWYKRCNSKEYDLSLHKKIVSLLSIFSLSISGPLKSWLLAWVHSIHLV